MRGVAVATLVATAVAGSPLPGAGAGAPAALGARTELVSLTNDGRPGERFTRQQVVSGTGRFVAFQTDAALVPADTNFSEDVYLRDRRARRTTLVSAALGGQAGDNVSLEPAITPSGRYVAFASIASDLVAGDTNDATDVFVWDRVTGTTERVSLDSAGGQVDDSSASPAMSDDGRYVVFGSIASDLVPGDTNGVADAFVRDRLAGTTSRVSMSSTGAEANGDTDRGYSISADGRRVAFWSRASNLVRGDENGVADAFVHDRPSGTTIRVSVTSGGREGRLASGEPTISGNGRYVAFSTAARLVPRDTNGVSDVHVRNLHTRRTRLVSVTPDGSAGGDSGERPSISHSGRYVAFSSRSDSLVAGDRNGAQDVFVRDRRHRVTVRASVSTSGTEADADSFAPALSANGRHVAFGSFASNLARGVPEATSQAYLRLRFADGS